MIQIRDREVYSTDGKWVHRKGTDEYFVRSLAGRTAEVEDYEEVEDLPKYTHREYARQVEQLVAERYSVTEEIAILRQRDTKPGEYESYYSYVEECKERAKELLIDKKGE